MQSRQNRSMLLVSVIFLTVGICFLAIGAVFWAAGGELPGSGNDYPRSYCRMEYLGASELGDSYEGAQAREGYTFYELFFSVTNTGDGMFYGELPWMYYEGEQYDDVFDYWEEPEEDPPVYDELFEGYEENCLPPQRTGQASQVVQVREGVTRFLAYYEPDYESGEQELEISLK